MTRLSWRDPDGYVFKYQGRILRTLRSERLDEIRSLIDEPWFRGFVDAGDIVRSWFNDDAEVIIEELMLPDGVVVMEHECLQLAAYPHEITALQLQESALLTLEIAEKALEFGWVLKDASAWNVLHSGGRARFLDVLSFVRHDKLAMWTAYAQFMRHFVIPLGVYRDTGLEPSLLFVNEREGCSPERAFKMLPAKSLFRLSMLESVAFPAMFAGRVVRRSADMTPLSSRLSEGQTLKIFQQTLKRLRNHVEANRPDTRAVRSTWATYETNRSHYSAAALEAKREAVKSMLEAIQPLHVLDLGCNTGEFSRMAAALGAQVVAADFDGGALTFLHERVRQANESVTALVMNVARPTAGVGWRNREVAPILDRLSSQFDVVLALGLLHHLIVSERVPLDEIRDFFVTLDSTWLMVEWVPPQDERFREIAGDNIDLYNAISVEDFERIFEKHYEIVERVCLRPGNRILYRLRINSIKEESS